LTALNLMPIGQLDGGHVVYAVAGKRSLWMGVAALFFMAVLGYWWPPWWFMGALLLLFMGLTGLRHPPPADPTVRLDPLRKFLAVVILIILFLIVARVPVAMI
ncbi:MAG: site-2 protease family protein, partial [bacterium]|nr:site-2 protease family protein [bacterium]